MMTDLIIGFALGILATLVMCGILGAIAWFIFWFIDRDYKYRIRIRNMTGGKAVMEWHKGKKSKVDGEFYYYVPSLRRENRFLLPYVSSAYELPLGKGLVYVPFTYYNDAYVPESFDPYTDEQEVEKIIESKIEPGTYEKVKQKIKVFIMRPVSISLRKWVLDADRATNKENALKLSWFERNKEFILLAVLMIVAGVVCFMMILFSFQYGVHVIDNPPITPDWAKALLNATLSNVSMAPPNIG